MLIGFNSGHYEAIDLSSWLSTTPVDMRATNFGVPKDMAAAMARETLFSVPRRTTES